MGGRSPAWALTWGAVCHHGWNIDAMTTGKTGQGPSRKPGEALTLTTCRHGSMFGGLEPECDPTDGLRRQHTPHVSAFVGGQPSEVQVHPAFPQVGGSRDPPVSQPVADNSRREHSYRELAATVEMLIVKQLGGRNLESPFRQQTPDVRTHVGSLLPAGQEGEEGAVASIRG